MLVPQSGGSTTRTGSLAPMAGEAMVRSIVRASIGVIAVTCAPSSAAGIEAASMGEATCAAAEGCAAAADVSAVNELASARLASPAMIPRRRRRGVAVVIAAFLRKTWAGDRGQHLAPCRA